MSASLVTVTASTLIIRNRYDTALRHELEDSTGQVGRLRAQAEALRTEQEARRREIEAVRAEIAAAEVALATAKREADESQCQALHARVDAAVTVKQVACYQQFAQQAQCVAERERKRASNTLFGALLGAGLAVATGSSSLLLTAGGGLIGSGSGGGPCPTPECQLDPLPFYAEVLREQELSGKLPECEKTYERQILAFPGVAGAPVADRRREFKRGRR